MHENRIFPRLMVSVVFSSIPALLFCNCLCAADITFSKERHRAALSTLFYIPSELAPVESQNHHASSKIMRSLCLMLIREGGYLHTSAQSVFSVDTSAVNRAGILFQQLELLNGRYSSTELNQNRDSIGALLPQIPIAAAYVFPSQDGLSAAAQCATLSAPSDPRAAACGRAMYRLLTACFRQEDTDKRALLSIAAQAADDLAVAGRIRASRIREWDQFEPLTTVVGKMERALFLWYSNEDFDSTMREAMLRLPCPHTRRFLSCLCAATYGLHALPEPVVWETAASKSVIDMQNGLLDLASDGILLSVPPLGAQTVVPAGKADTETLPPAYDAQADNSNITDLPSFPASFTDSSDRTRPAEHMPPAESFFRLLVPQRQPEAAGPRATPNDRDHLPSLPRLPDLPESPRQE